VKIAELHEEARRKAEETVKTYGAGYSEHDRERVFQSVFQRELERVRMRIADELRPEIERDLHAQIAAAKSPEEQRAAIDSAEAEMAALMRGV
jgi:hypothetical protein